MTKKGVRLEEFEYGTDWVYARVARHGPLTITDLVQASGLVEDEADGDQWEMARRTLTPYAIDAEHEGLIALSPSLDGDRLLTLTLKGAWVWGAPRAGV